MRNANIDVYARFLAECRKVIGSFDLERLAYDQSYKTEFFNSVNLSADDQLFQLAAAVNHQLNEEMLSTH
jgi:hypothetical protein